MDEPSFVKVVTKAEAKLNRLTFDHILCEDGEYGQIVRGSFTAFTESELTAVQMGVCALADTVNAMEIMQSSTGGKGALHSVSSGGESITYAGSRYTDALSDPNKEYQLYKDTLLDYVRPELFAVNPLYAGVR